MKVIILLLTMTTARHARMRCALHHYLHHLHYLSLSQLFSCASLFVLNGIIYVGAIRGELYTDKFYHTEPCLRLSAAIDRAGRARDIPFARTVALICNTCGSSELSMREDEWCVRMRLRPDCGGILRTRGLPGVVGS